MVTVREVCRKTAALLTTHEIEEATLEARLLVEAVTGYAPAQLLLDPPFPDSAQKPLEELLKKRISGIPVQYCLGKWWFYGMEFLVGEGVLIPRQDTEILVDEAIAFLSGKEHPVFLDLCSGSGCIPIAVGANLPNCKAYAVEYSAAAYRYLTKNKSALQADFLTPMLGDALDKTTLHAFADESLDCITSNPPYLNDSDMASLQKEVRFEPSDALYAPENGLYFYHMLSKLWKCKLKKGGLLAFEVGLGQADTVAAFMQAEGFFDISTHRDYAGIDRVVCGKRT